MNSQEREQLDQFLKQLTEVRLTSKDTEAEKMIKDAMIRQADAAYLLVQRSLLMEQALNNAKAQINQLQQQLQVSQTSGTPRGGFLNHDPWAQPAPSAGPVPGMGNYGAPRYAPQAQPSGFFGGGGSSFLGNVATTAAGVVAGSFLFQGIESLLNHHSPSSWMEQTANADHQAVENVTVNNYYGDDAIAAEDSPFQQTAYEETVDENPSDVQDDSNSDWI